MIQYVLHVMSYDGIVPGARHYRGRVEGPHPQSCHGGTRYSGGKKTCSESHELPGRVEWQVEAQWTEARYERYAAGGFEGDGPSAFLSSKDVIDCAMIRFLDGASEWWEHKVEPAQDGDELWYGWVNPEGGQLDDPTDPEDGWGCMIASCHRG
jgi:hypothetical protein